MNERGNAQLVIVKMGIKMVSDMRSNQSQYSSLICYAIERIGNCKQKTQL